MSTELFRTQTSKAFRTRDIRLVIDPGFVHTRRVETIIGARGMQLVDNLVRDLPDMPDGARRVRIDHIYTRLMLIYCTANNVPTLEESLAKQNYSLFCSTLKVRPCKTFYDVERAVSDWEPTLSVNRKVKFQYSTQRVVGDTLRGRLHQGSTISMVGLFAGVDGSDIVVDPLIMGFPWLESDNPRWNDELMFYTNEFYENYIEDFSEFSNVTTLPLPSSHALMKNVPEAGFKRALAKILGEQASNELGRGNVRSLYKQFASPRSTGINAAFLLKGPARYRPMTVAHLGKNGDQILRLAQEPADVLIVQHCHDIMPPVRTLLRAMVVQPGRPRRFCCVDGRESLRLLKTFDLYDFASKKRCQ